MTFYVQKSLAHGPIRFGVSPRKTLEQIDDDASLSTGKAGDFLARGTHGFFFADEKPVGAPTVPATPSISRTPFLQSLRGEGARGIGYVALMIAGAILVLLGFAVVAKKGAAGWVEVILGAAMIATPIILTARKRQQIRLEEEKVRAEREERERRERAMLETYTAALNRLREDPSDANLAAAAHERQGLDLPYEIWSALAKRTVLQIGFEALARLTPSAARQVSELMSRASEAVGLSGSDAKETKLDLYRVLLWHLLADDRHGNAQSEQLVAFRKGFEIGDGDLPVEAGAAEELGKLRGIDKGSLPRTQCGIPLRFREYCIHSAPGTLLSEKGKPRGTGSLFVTNKRVFIDLKKPIEIELMQIDDVEVDIDANVLIVRAAKPHKPVIMKVEQPLYTAALIDLATGIDERPRGFA